MRLALRSRHICRHTVYISQTTECPVASFAVILAYHGRHVPLEELREVMGVSRDCASAADILHAAKHYGLKARAVRTEIDDLPKHGFPLIAHMNFIHFTVVEGIADGRVFLNDSASGKHDIALERFSDVFTGVALTFESTPEFRPGGTPVAPLRSMLQRFAPWKWSLVLYVLLCVVTSFPVVVAAIAAGGLVDGTMPTGRATWCLAVGMAVGLGIAFFLRELVLARAERSFVFRQTSTFLQHVLTLPFAFFNYRMPADLQTSIRSNRTLAKLVAQDIAHTIAAAIEMVILAVAIVCVQPVVGTVVASAAVVQSWILLLLGRACPRRRVTTAYREADGRAIAMFERMELQRTGGLDAENIAGQCAASANEISTAHELGELEAWAKAVPHFFMFLGGFVVLASGIFMLGHEPPAVGTLVALHILTYGLFRASVRITEFPSLYEQIDEAVNRIQEVEDIESGRSGPDVAAKPASGVLPEPALALHNVTFGYARHKPPQIEDISLVVRTRGMLGITGTSAGGKSTLAGAIAGLHRPWSGHIELDGKPLDSYSRNELARKIAWTSKTPVLFEGTLRENLTLWDDSVSDNALQDAIRDACLEDVVSERGDSLEARVSSRGANFSGGQRQRIEVARALVRNPSLVILDEAIDAIEPRLDGKILDNLRERGCTLIVITHRASTLERCEDVIKIERGRVVSGKTMPQVEDPAATRDSPFHGHRTSGSDHQNSRCTADTSHSPHVRDPQTQGALSAVFKVVADATRLAATSSDSIAVTQDEAGVLRLARQANLQARPVRLVLNNWWQRDNGPLIGFQGKDKKPIALLPQAGRPYLVCDPRDGRRRVATADLAQQIDRRAYTLHGRLSDQVTRLSQLLLAGLPLVRADIATGVLCSAAISSLALAPAVAVIAIDTISRPAALIAGFGLAALSTLLFGFVQHLAEMRVTARLKDAAHAGLWYRIYRLPVSYFRRKRAGELLRYTKAAEEYCVVLVDAVIASTTFIMPCVVVLAVVGWFTPSAAGVACLLLALPLIIAATLTAAERILEERVYNMSNSNASFLFDALRGFARLWSGNSERRVIAEWEKRLHAQVSLEEELRRRQAWRCLLKGWYPSVAIVTYAVVVVMRHPSTSSHVIGGVIWAFGVAASMLPGVIDAVVSFGQARLQRERGEPLLRTAFETSNGKRRPEMLQGAIDVRNVTFSWDPPGATTATSHSAGDNRSWSGRCRNDRTVLDNVSLRVEPGEFVALAGPSGGGKSTLLRLILGFENPHEGVVLFDDVPLVEWDLTSLRTQIGAVLQEDAIDVCTLRGNLAGTAPYGMDEIWEATRIAALDDDIRRMPMGIQTILQDDMLSSGQKQRLLIAAKVLRHPRVLFLDEATSALDDTLQRRVMANIRALGITCVFVAHRASTVLHADRVIVIDDGRVVQSGRPTALFETSGPLATLHERDQEKILAGAV